MSEKYTPPPEYRPNAGFSVGRLMIYMVLLAAAGAIGYNYYNNNVRDFTTNPEEVTLRYVDTDFKANIDEENALAILSNPRRYQREFSDLVYQINSQLVNHTATRMGLPDSLRKKAIAEYKNIHPQMTDMYFQDFVTMSDTTSALYQAWYNNQYQNATEAINIVASKYTCFFINRIFDSILKTKQGQIYVRGKKINSPCGVALSEALAPMVERLKKRAAIDDFTTSEGMMEEKIEKAIAELATMEVRDRKGLSKKLQTKVFGFNVSQTDVEVTAISMMKVGFKLNRYFDVGLNEKRKMVVVTLPEPEILSHEVYPKFEKLDVGWLREVENVELNQNINVLREAFREDAYQSDVFDKAKEQVEELMELMLTPVVSQLRGNYKIAIRYRNLDLEPLGKPDKGEKEISLPNERPTSQAELIDLSD